MKLLYRIDEVAEMLSISRRSVYRLLDDGELDGHLDGGRERGIKIIWVSILKYIEKHQIKVSNPSADFRPTYPLRPKRKVISKGIE
jgi:excisionase family DNA binding protein